MAVAAAVGGSTPYSLNYLITHNGAAGNTLVLTNAQMLADILGNANHGPLKELLERVFNPNSQDIARQRMLGQTAAAGSRLNERAHCEVSITARDGTTVWLVDADVDAVAAGNFELNITGTAAAGTAVLKIKFQHTFTG
jgi:hypothetical protein